MRSYLPLLLVQFSALVIVSSSGCRHDVKKSGYPKFDPSLRFPEWEWEIRKTLAEDGIEITQSAYARLRSTSNAWSHSRCQMYERIGFNEKSIESHFLSNLIWAAWKGDTRLVKNLLRETEVVNEPRGLGPCVTPLIAAVWGNHFDVVRLLLANGADIDLRGEAQGPVIISGQTALEEAIRMSAVLNSDAMVDLLLKNGADLQTNYNAVRFSVLLGNEAMVGLLLQYANNPRAVLDQQVGENTPLILAAEQLDPEMIQFLISRGADCKSQGGQAILAAMRAWHVGDGPIGYPRDSVDRRKEEVVKILLRLGANGGYADPDGKSLLDWASTLGLARCTRALSSSAEEPGPEQGQTQE